MADGIRLMMQVRLNPVLRLAEPADLAQVARFLTALGSELFGEASPNESPQDSYRRWKYFRNPLGEAIAGIAIADNAVVSTVAATPKRILIAGKEIVAYELSDFLTDPSYRKMGLFSQLIELVCREVESRGASLVYVRPNEMSFPILVGKLSFQEVLRMDARRFALPSHIISRKTGIPCGALRFSGVDALLKLGCIPSPDTTVVTVVPLRHFDEDIDQLWQRASAGYDFALVRDSTYLNWRFADCPTAYKIWLALRDGQSVGFLVARADQTAPVATIVDLFTQSNDTDAAGALLARGMGDLLGSGVQSINTSTLQGPQPSAAQRLLQRSFPFRRKKHLHLVFRILRPQEIALPATSRKWYFAHGDCDGV
jgi:GNAT superfamily N-acetyltransferase